MAEIDGVRRVSGVEKADRMGDIGDPEELGEKSSDCSEVGLKEAVDEALDFEEFDW